jgi:hypothetical protein
MGREQDAVACRTVIAACLKHPQQFNRLVEIVGARAELPFPLHFHMLRHSCGYKLANDGIDTRAIQDWLGHRSITHTTRYTELSPVRFKDFLKRVRPILVIWIFAAFRTTLSPPAGRRSGRRWQRPSGLTSECLDWRRQKHNGQRTTQ